MKAQLHFFLREESVQSHALLFQNAAQESVDSLLYVVHGLNNGPGTDVVVGHSINDVSYIGHHNGTEAHYTWLTGGVKDTVMSVLLQLWRAGKQSVQFSVRNITVMCGKTVRSSPDNPIIINDHRTYRAISSFQGGLSFHESFSHEALVIHE